MGSKKDLRNRGHFRNSKTTNSWSHMEDCLVLGNTALDSMQMASQGALHWGTGDLLGVMRATDWLVGMANQSTLLNQAWSRQRGWVWAKGGFPEFLSEVFKNILWALLYLRWISNNELLYSTGNSAQLYDSLDGRGNFGTRIHRYIQLSLFTVYLKLRILLISYTPIQNKISFNKVWIMGMLEEKLHSL